MVRATKGRVKMPEKMEPKVLSLPWVWPEEFEGSQHRRVLPCLGQLEVFQTSRGGGNDFFFFLKKEAIKKEKK